jgi:hypothetical protein
MAKRCTLPDFNAVTVGTATSQRRNHSADRPCRLSLFRFSGDAGNPTHTLNLEFLFDSATYPALWEERHFVYSHQKAKEATALNAPQLRLCS